jgi:BirA family biotin operon repressor/biotin-[acetyl-CoA-carboxylase] ligase
MSSLAPEVVEPLLTGRFGRPYVYRETCASTQDLLEASQPEGAVAACEEQTAGRGRLGRRWEVPRGTAVMSSTLLRPPEGRRLPELALVGGVAAANALEAALTLAAQIKWPNDVLVNRKKVAGVLAETRDGVVVLGIGVNVNQTRDELPSGTHPAAASLRTTDGIERERAPLLARLLVELERAYSRWLDDGLDAIYVDLGSRDFLRQRRVTVDGRSGVAVGIDRAGRLEVDVNGERLLVESGEVGYER